MTSPTTKTSNDSSFNKSPNDGSYDNNADEDNNPITVWPANKLPSELKKARGKPQWSSLSSGKSEQAQLLRADMAWSLSGKLQSYKRES